MKSKSGKEPITTIIVLIIMLAAAGMLIYWSTFVAFPAAQGAVVCDAIAKRREWMPVASGAFTVPDISCEPPCAGIIIGSGHIDGDG